MKKYCIAICLLTAVIPAYTQEAFDLLRYSTPEVYGSARSMSMANAFGAIGGDVTAISINPAGLGINYTSELLYASASAVNHFTSGASEERKDLDDAACYRTTSFGAIWAYPSGKETGLVNYDLGITYNRIKNFDRNTYVSTSDNTLSLLDNLSPGGNMENMAYNAYLLDGDYSPAQARNGKLRNLQYIEESGGIDVWDFSYAFNWGYVLYMGASMGVQVVSYYSDSYYDEYFEGGGSFRLRNGLSTYGMGVNLKMGAILRPFPALRLGFSYHSPTYYDMVDNYSTSLTSSNVPDDNNLLTETIVSTMGDVHYQLSTPQRCIYSVALQLGRKGFISMDYEQVNYGTMKMYDNYGNPYEDVNLDVNQYFRAVCDFRMGMEWRFSKHFSARGGYAYYPSPVKSEVEKTSMIVHTPSTAPHYSIDKGMNVYSGGVGLRFGFFYMDFAMVNQIHTEHFYPYDQADGIDTKSNTFNFVSSFGLKFQ